MFTKSSPGNIKSPTMKEFLLIVSLSLVFLSVESYRQKYHGKYFQYGPYGRSSLSGLRGGLSGGFDDGFRTTSFSGSSLDDFGSLGSLGSLSSVSRRSLLPGRYTYQKHGHSSTSGLSLSGLRGFEDDGFSSISSLSSLPQRGFSASSGLSLSGLQGLDDDSFSSNSPAPILPQNSYRADPYSDLSYPKPLPAFRGGLTGLQRNDLTLSSGLDDDFSALGGGTRSNLIRSGSFDDDDFEGITSEDSLEYYMVESAICN
uniref:Uncharacterized protein n=1 Tax=Magallana gigas TaxID=29159 RepID=A0A8W8NRZ9_MAGGI